MFPRVILAHEAGLIWRLYPHMHTLIVVHSCYGKTFECLPGKSHRRPAVTHTHKVTAPSLLFTSASPSPEATSTSERSVQTEWLCWSGIRSGGRRWQQWWSPWWRREPRFRIRPEPWRSLTFRSVISLQEMDPAFQIPDCTWHVLFNY